MQPWSVFESQKAEVAGFSASWGRGKFPLNGFFWGEIVEPLVGGFPVLDQAQPGNIEET
jgi:hypothetical protein